MPMVTVGCRWFPGGISPTVADAAMVLLLAGYVSTVIIQALHGQSNAAGFAVAWGVLQVDAVLCAVLCAWLMVRLWRVVRVGGVSALRWSVYALTLLGLLAALTVMAFWGLFSW